MLVVAFLYWLKCVSIASDCNGQGGFDFGKIFVGLIGRPRFAQDIIVLLLFFVILSIVDFRGVSDDCVIVLDNLA